MMGLHGGDHGIDRTVLERMHRGGPGAVYVAELRVAGEEVQSAPVLEAERAPSVAYRRDLGRAVVDVYSSASLRVQRMRSRT